MKYLIFSFSLLLILLVILAGLYFYLTQVHTRNLNDTILIISKGESVRSISKKLKDNDIVISDGFFTLFVLLNGYQKDLKAGEYEFSGKYTLREVVNKIIEHDIKLRRITIPEGLTLSQIGDIFEKNGLFAKSEFMNVLNDDLFRRKQLGTGINSFEGVLFPDTYSYWKDIQPQELVEMMLSRKNEVINQIKKENGEIKSASNLNEYEIFILASIIEKESSYETERELVSSVFHNRLRIGMKLDSDPTVIYGLGEKFDGNLRKTDLETYTPYNTYLKAGLPPTPIANPGKASLYAALYPADTQYLYFVSKGDGSHHFSKSYGEHIKAVYEYQINSNRN